MKMSNISGFFEGQVGELILLIWLKALLIKTCYLDKWYTPEFSMITFF